MEESKENEDLNFFGHIEELRKRIFIALIWLIIACALAGYFIEPIMDNVLLAPATIAKLKLQNLRPFGVPFLYFKLIFIVGFIIASPLILHQLWKFIEPALYIEEKKWARRITILTSLCFFTGVAFAYYLMIPSMLKFAATFGTNKIENNIDINEYFGFVSMMLLGAGAIFEMPMLSYVLTKFQIITPKFLTKYWRHAIVIIFILAAVLTPTPDPINQMMFAVPLIILYIISIWVSKLSYSPKVE